MKTKPIFLALAALALAANVTHAQEPVPFSALRLPDERVLQTPYWWAWSSADADVKRPLNVLTEPDAQRLIQAYGNDPFQAFVAARAQMFYEPGVILRQTFTTTLYSGDNSPQVWSETVYFSTTYAIRELVTSTVTYQNPAVDYQGQNAFYANSPYGRYRFIVEDYAGDRIVGVNLDRNGQVVACALIERAILERPATIWTLPLSLYEAPLKHKHRREPLYRLVISGYGFYPDRPTSEVIFEQGRLRPLYGRHVYYKDIFYEDPSPLQSFSFQMTYDAVIPDFLSSNVCQRNDEVRLGYPSEVGALFGGSPVGEVRIARSYTLDDEKYTTFAIVASSSLSQTLDVVRSRLQSGWKGKLETESGRIYGYPSVSFFSTLPSNLPLNVLQIDVLALEANKTLVRGKITKR